MADSFNFILSDIEAESYFLNVIKQPSNFYLPPDGLITSVVIPGLYTVATNLDELSIEQIDQMTIEEIDQLEI